MKVLPNSFTCWSFSSWSRGSVTTYYYTEESLRKSQALKMEKGLPGAFCGSEKLCARLLHSSGMWWQPGVDYITPKLMVDWYLPFCPFSGPCLPGQAVQTWDGHLCIWVLKGRSLPGSWYRAPCAHVCVCSSDHAGRNLQNFITFCRWNGIILPRSYQGQSLTLASGSMCRKGHSLLWQASGGWTNDYITNIQLFCTH